MNASDLIAFLSTKLAAREFQLQIKEEVEIWVRQLSERGRSGPIFLLGMNERFDITPERALVLLDAYIADDLTGASFAYALDALLLEERFQWTNLPVRDAMESVLGEYYPAKMDKNRALEAREEVFKGRLN